MRILQLTKYYPPAPGGIESFVRDLSHAFTDDGHENLVLGHRFEASEPTDMTGSMGRVVRVPSLGEIMYAPMAPAYPFHLHRHIQEFKPDLILVHMPNVSGFWPLFFALPCPLAIYWHSDVIFPRSKVAHNLAYRGYSIFEKRLLGRAERIFVSSPPYLEHSAPLRPYRDKCSVVPLGIDNGRIPAITADQVAATTERILGPGETRFVYAAGRFSHYKGFDRLVEAASKLKDVHPDVRFVIGGDGETRPDVARRIRDLGLDRTVFLPGRIPDADYWGLMKGCELFCLPSVERTEAFGIVLLEAMAMGKPCISTSIPGSGTGWVNNHGQTGLVVPPDDVNALAGALDALLASEAQRKELGAGGAHRFAEDFSMCRTGRSILGL